METKFINGNVHIPDWISFHIYNEKSNKLRIYISNEVTHEFLMLEGVSAELWKVISEAKTNNEIYEFAEKVGGKGEINEFLSELHCSGLISFSNGKNVFPQNVIDNILPINDEETANFQMEMRNNLIENGYLPRLFLELTYNCNLKCIHCFNDKETHSNIKFDDIKKIIDDAYDLGVFGVTMSGGECTLDGDFLKIAKYIRSKRISLDIFTNGQTLYDNEEFFDELLKLYLYRVSLSLYSMDEEVHEKITGVKGSFKKTISVIEKLLKNNISVEIKCFLTKINADSYEKVAEYAEKIGASHTLACMFVNNPTRNNADVQVTDEQLYIIYSNDKSLLKVKSCFDINDENFIGEKVCMGGHSGLCVDPNSDVYTCPTLKILLGNLKTSSLKDIWNGRNNVGTKLNKIRSLTKSDLKDCFKHEYCKFCVYCPGMAMMDGRYMQKYEQYCRHAKIKMHCFSDSDVV